MHIKKLHLKNYRNYEVLEITLNEELNVIIGDNAQGKTNLLEAIYLLAFARSYRTTKDDELIRWGNDFAKVNGEIVKENQHLPLEIILSKRGKIARLNHLEQQRLSDYIGSLNVVMFAPEDLEIVKGSPQIRRRFLDMELGQIQPSYVYHLGQYQKILRQRNHLLKKLQKGNEQDLTFLEILTEQLIDHASTLLHRRFKFIDLLKKLAFPIHSHISQKKEKLEIKYKSTIHVSEEDPKEKIVNKYMEKFSELQKNEINRGVTLVGPHRDDVMFYINDKEVKKFGSQGQQRTTALSIKLAEIDLIHHEVGEYPVLLLDDVLSELDSLRQSLLLKTIQGKVQTFVSTTSVDGIHQDLLKRAKFFNVKNGKII